MDCFRIHWCWYHRWFHQIPEHTDTRTGSHHYHNWLRSYTGCYCIRQYPYNWAVLLKRNRKDDIAILKCYISSTMTFFGCKFIFYNLYPQPGHRIYNRQWWASLPPKKDRTRVKENTFPVNHSQREILFTAQNILLQNPLRSWFFLFNNLQHFVNWHSYRCIRVYRHRRRNLRYLDKQWEDLHTWLRRSHQCSLHNLAQ